MNLIGSSVWYQEAYFLRTLQDEIDSAREGKTALCLILLRMPECSRRAARHLLAYAESEERPAFFGILGNGDYAICLPGSDQEDGLRERRDLTDLLGEFGAYSGLALLDGEETAAELLRVAADACNAVQTYFAKPDHGTTSANRPVARPA